MNLLKLTDINKFFSLIYVYKTLNNLTYSPFRFQVRNVPHYELRNDNYQLVIPFTRHKYIQLFIGTRGPLLWNNLPVAIKIKTSIASFKRALRKSYINMYVE